MASLKALRSLSIYIRSAAGYALIKSLLFADPRTQRLPIVVIAIK